MNIPVKNPTTEVRNAVVLAGLQQISGNPVVAQNLFDAMSDLVRTQNYIAFRNMAIGIALSTPSLAGTKIKVTHFVQGLNAIPQLAGTVDPNGNAQIVGYEKDGCVSVIYPVTCTVPADNISGLLS